MLVKEYQLDPVTHAVLHADFYRVAMDRMLQVTIPITVKGEPKGVKQQGGILEFVTPRDRGRVPAGDIPEHVEIDVSELMLHQGVRVRDIATDPKWTPLSDLDLMLVHVIMPKAEEVGGARPKPVAAPTATAEPEVIKKGKKDEEATRRDKKARDEDRRSRRRAGVAESSSSSGSAIRAPKYRGTRHNIGFAVVDEVARRAGVAFESAPVEALIAQNPSRRIATLDPVLLAKPLTFMNAQRRGGRRTAAVLQDRPRRSAGRSSTKCSCRWRGCGRGRGDRPAGTTG